MPQTPNHGYNVPNEGATDWHLPLNENFEQYDTDIEIRDQSANRGDYKPKAGSKFFATDTGQVYIGNGSSWNRLASTGASPILSQLNPNNDFLGVGRSSKITAAEYFGVEAPVGSESFGGMYVNTDGGGWPFFGYAAGGSSQAWHFYDPSDDTWKLNNGGRNLSVDSSGRVGIGTGSPTVPLDVRGKNNWDLSSSDGDLRIGDADHRFAIGVALGGSGAGNVSIRAKDGDAMKIGVNDIDYQLEIEESLTTLNTHLEVVGEKNFVERVDTPSGEREVVYTACESDTAHTETSGVAELDDGRAEIGLPEHFAWVTDADEPLIVQTTPYGGSSGMKVTERSTERLVVKDLDGEGEYEFAYTVKGTREGHADKEVVREPSTQEASGAAPAPADD